MKSVDGNITQYLILLNTYFMQNYINSTFCILNKICFASRNVKSACVSFKLIVGRVKNYIKFYFQVVDKNNTKTHTCVLRGWEGAKLLDPLVCHLIEGQTCQLASLTYSSQESQ